MRNCKPGCTGQPGCTGTIYIAETNEPLPGHATGNRIKIGFTHKRTPAARAKDLARAGYQIIWHYQHDDHGHPATWDTEQLIHNQIKADGQPAWHGREYYEVTGKVIRAIAQHLLNNTDHNKERANKSLVRRLQQLHIVDINWSTYRHYHQPPHHEHSADPNNLDPIA